MKRIDWYNFKLNSLLVLAAALITPLLSNETIWTSLAKWGIAYAVCLFMWATIFHIPQLIMEYVRNRKQKTKDLLDELYDFRMVYSALIFNRWAKEGKYDVHKSVRYFDGTPTDPDWEYFLICAKTPAGIITHHYPVKYWHYFDCSPTDNIKYGYDGHTSKDVLATLKILIRVEDKRHNEQDDQKSGI